jgi:hypothetical protein
MIHDTLFLHSFVPASTLYSLVFDTSNGEGQVYLKPIV